MPAYGSQRNPHKYLQRLRRPDGKWAYVYASHGMSYPDVVRNTSALKVVIAQGAPTSLRIDGSNIIVEGPRDLVGRQLFKNTNPARAYTGIARDPSGKVPPKYLYPESHLKDVTVRKAAKFVKASRALVGLNKEAEMMMVSPDPVKRDYGLAIWLNNNTQMRIGAHQDASSVNPTERGKILKQARDENWSPELTQAALAKARQQTYGLLTLRNGHVSLGDYAQRIITFRFIGKGGKENTYSAPVTPLVYNLITNKKLGEDRAPDKPLFHPDVNYKKIWRMYKAHGTTPHISRGYYADSLVRQLMKDYQVYDQETGRTALRRFNEEMQTVVSNHLNHSRSVTEKSYLSPTTRQSLDDFRNGLEAHVGVLREHYTDGISDALGEVLLWRELGVGNTVI